MNKLISGAIFSSEVAMARRAKKFARSADNFLPRNIRQGMTSWERAAEGFEKNDPDGTKLAELLDEAGK